MSYGILPLFSSQLYNFGSMNEASSSSSSTFPQGFAEILEGDKVTLYGHDFSSLEPELYNYYLPQPDQTHGPTGGTFGNKEVLGSSSASNMPHCDRVVAGAILCGVDNGWCQKAPGVKGVPVNLHHLGKRDINVPLQPPLMIDYQYRGVDDNHGLIQQPFSPGKILSDWRRQQNFCTTENPKKRMNDVRDQKGVNKKLAHQERMQGVGCTRDRVPIRRSQKLADKITALQKLVSPYGKTDTASVLQEAHISINLLHDQIQKLLQNTHNNEPVTGLHNKGLCLVPISSPSVNNLCHEKQIFMPRKY